MTATHIRTAKRGQALESASLSRRGRPKGTGIDDRIWLRELDRLIAIDPSTPPTTAIKALGISDPSTIRRLRDKHKRRVPSQSRG
jgi:hypothetical protein